jgi:hypothetical protein
LGARRDRRPSADIPRASLHERRHVDKKAKSPIPQKTEPPKTGNVRERGRVGDTMIGGNEENQAFVKGTIEPNTKK